MITICLDAGHNHSGADTGAQGFGLQEQDVSFAIASGAAQSLEKLGFSVVKTRPARETNLGADVNSSLQARCDIANQAGADYFISIHCNAGGGAGSEVYVVQKGGQAEALANKVLSRLVNTLGTQNRGVKTANYKVLRSTNMPAILVETAFIDNASDVELLKNRQPSFATAIAQAICEQVGVNYMQQNEYSYDNTVNNMVKDGVTTLENMAYWEKVLNEGEPVNPAYLRALLNRYHEKAR